MLSRFLPALTLMSLCTLMLPAAHAKVRLSGKVTDLDGKPIADAEIEIVAILMERTWKTKTKKNGEWAQIVDSSEWKFKATAAGYEPVEDHKTLASLGRKPTLDFKMAPAGSSAPVAAVAAGVEQPTPAPQIDLADLKAGNALYDQGKYQEAIASYEQALVKNPTLLQIHIAIADAHAQLQNWEKAAEHYKLVPTTDQRHERALVGLASATIRMEKFDEAAGVYKQILALNPANPDANYMVGQLLFDRSNDAQGALPYLQAAASAKPDWAPVYLKLGYVQVNLGNNAEAKAAFQKYLELNPTAADAADVKAMVDMLQ
jgi:tetratricopeptide (TPR) repeat protein